MKLRFSKNIYPYKAIEIAMVDYKDFGSIELSEEENYWIVEFQNYSGDFDRLKKEFSNYLIEVVNGVDCE